MSHDWDIPLVCSVLTGRRLQHWRRGSKNGKLFFDGFFFLHHGRGVPVPTHPRTWPFRPGTRRGWTMASVETIFWSLHRGTRHWRCYTQALSSSSLRRNERAGPVWDSHRARTPGGPIRKDHRHARRPIQSGEEHALRATRLSPDVSRSERTDWQVCRPSSTAGQTMRVLRPRRSTPGPAARQNRPTRLAAKTPRKGGHDPRWCAQDLPLVGGNRPPDRADVQLCNFERDYHGTRRSPLESTTTPEMESPSYSPAPWGTAMPELWIRGTQGRPILPSQRPNLPQMRQAESFQPEVPVRPKYWTDQLNTITAMATTSATPRSCTSRHRPRWHENGQQRLRNSLYGGTDRNYSDTPSHHPDFRSGNHGNRRLRSFV